jgi:hypothetical protein
VDRTETPPSIKDLTSSASPLLIALNSLSSSEEHEKTVKSIKAGIVYFKRVFNYDLPIPNQY